MNTLFVVGLMLGWVLGVCFMMLVIRFKKDPQTMSNENKDWIVETSVKLADADLIRVCDMGPVQDIIRSHQPTPPPVPQDVRELAYTILEKFRTKDGIPIPEAVTLIQSFLHAREQKRDEIHRALNSHPEAKVFENMKHELFVTKASEKLNAEYARGFELQLQESKKQNTKVVRVLEQVAKCLQAEHPKEYFDENCTGCTSRRAITQLLAELKEGE